MAEQLSDELLAFETDHVWISKNMPSLLAKFGDQWIAVKGG
ncbi:MAG: hypothetical protein AB1502_00550 [Thermodesulfobacteriota bacterium]